MNLKHLGKDFFSLFFPPLCLSCSKVLVRGESYICSGCQLRLPRTGFHMLRENPLSQVFWGRIPVEAATALFYYQKGGMVQQLVAQIKYRGQYALGVYLGRLMGRELLRSPHFTDIGMVVPVPLHPDRLKKRGFNQSEAFGLGISQILDIPLKSDALHRVQRTQTQTRKGRFHRWKNVSGVFRPSPGFKGQNVLLVDDVLTTGSTLEACAQAILQGKGSRVWIATIGFTA